jgi:hypothetical protein
VTILGQDCKKQFIPFIGLDSVNLTTIRKFARKAWCYMDIYRKEVGGKLAEYNNNIIIFFLNFLYRSFTPLSTLLFSRILISG